MGFRMLQRSNPSNNQVVLFVISMIPSKTGTDGDRLPDTAQSTSATPALAGT